MFSYSCPILSPIVLPTHLLLPTLPQWASTLLCSACVLYSCPLTCPSPSLPIIPLPAPLVTVILFCISVSRFEIFNMVSVSRYNLHKQKLFGALSIFKRTNGSWDQTVWGLLFTPSFISPVILDQFFLTQITV